MQAMNNELNSYVVASFGLPETLEKILSAKVRRIAFLISVGQHYHVNDYLTATVDLIKQVICNERELLGSNYTAKWEIVVIIADTLQAYNDQMIEKTLQDSQAEWQEKGTEWELIANAIFEPITELLLKYSCGAVNFYHWSDALRLSQQQFNFTDKFAILNHAYNTNQQFKNAVCQKGFNYLKRRQKSALLLHPANDQLPENNLKYILEEVALLMGSMSEGLFFNKDNHNPIFLMYPSEQEKAFSMGQALLKQGTCSEVTWREFKLKANLRISDADFRGCSHHLVCACRVSNRDIIKNKLIELGCLAHDHPNVFPGPQPEAKWPLSRQFYVQKFQDLQGTGILILHGLEGMGKRQLAAHYFNTQATNKVLTIWLESKKDGEMRRSIRKLLKKFKVTNPDNIKTVKELDDVFCQWLETQQDFVLVFSDVENYSDITIYLDLVCQKKKGKIIVTAKQKSPEKYWPYCCEVKEITRDETAELVRYYLKSSDISEADIDEINKYFAGFLLPLEIFLMQPGLTPQSLRECLNTMKSQGNEHDDAKKKVLSSLNYAKYQLKRFKSSPAELALALLNFLIFMDWTAIDQRILVTWCNLYDPDACQYLDKAISLLVEYGYIKEDNKCYSFHSYVHETLREDKRDSYLLSDPNALTDENIREHYLIIATLADMIWYRFDEEDYDDMIQSLIAFFNHARRQEYFLERKIHTKEQKSRLSEYLTPRLVMTASDLSFLEQLESLGQSTAICIMFKDPRFKDSINSAMQLIKAKDFQTINSKEINAVIKFMVADYVYNSHDNPLPLLIKLLRLPSSSLPKNKAVVLKLLTAVSFVGFSDNQGVSLQIITVLHDFLTSSSNSNFFSYLLTAFGGTAAANADNGADDQGDLQRILQGRNVMSPQPPKSPK